MADCHRARGLRSQGGPDLAPSGSVARIRLDEVADSLHLDDDCLITRLEISLDYEEEMAREAVGMRVERPEIRL